MQILDISLLPAANSGQILRYPRLCFELVQELIYTYKVMNLLHVTNWNKEKSSLHALYASIITYLLILITVSSVLFLNDFQSNMKIWIALLSHSNRQNLWY